MPYVPSKKTDGKSQDRELIDIAVEPLAVSICERVIASPQNVIIFDLYRQSFLTIARTLYLLQQGAKTFDIGLTGKLAEVIFQVAEKYKYDGAWFGELNYAITRLIQVVPNKLVEAGHWKSALRYWSYAGAVGILKKTSDYFSTGGGSDYGDNWVTDGLVGVFIDIKDEYKRRVNTSYEAQQIIKSGDCYDAPYFTRLIAVIDKETKKIVGYQEVMIKKEDDLGKDILGKMYMELNI